MKEVLLFSLSNLGSKTDVTITSRTLSESGDLRTIVFGLFLEHNIFNVMFYKQDKLLSLLKFVQRSSTQVFIITNVQVQYNIRSIG